MILSSRMFGEIGESKGLARWLKCVASPVWLAEETGECSKQPFSRGERLIEESFICGCPYSNGLDRGQAASY